MLVASYAGEQLCHTMCPNVLSIVGMNVDPTFAQLDHLYVYIDKGHTMCPMLRSNIGSNVDSNVKVVKSVVPFNPSGPGFDP